MSKMIHKEYYSNQDYEEAVLGLKKVTELVN